MNQTVTYRMSAQTDVHRTMLRILDHTSAVLEGMYRILMYTQTQIQLEVSWGELHIQGEDLCICRMDGMQMAVNGQIRQIFFQT